MTSTPRPVVDDVVRSVCGHRVERLVPLAGGGLHEVYRAELADGVAVVVRIGREPVAWFTDERRVMAQARAAGVPTPEVLGVESREHEGEPLSFSVLRLLPGRPLADVAADLSPSDLERVLADAGELLAQVHALPAEGGTTHRLTAPDDELVARAVAAAGAAGGDPAAATVERGAELVRHEVAARPAPRLSLAHGDYLPKHLLVDDGAVVGVLDWEFAGPASPAHDLARWEVSAGDVLHDRSDLLRAGYARVTDPHAAAEGWVPASAVAWALEVLAWRNPATAARQRRCVQVVARHVRG